MRIPDIATHLPGSVPRDVGEFEELAFQDNS